MNDSPLGMWSTKWCLDQLMEVPRIAVQLAGSFQVPISKRVAYVGWVGKGNLGDEAIYEAICRQFSPLCLRPFFGVRKEAFLERTIGSRRLYSHALLGGGTLMLGGYL